MHSEHKSVYHTEGRGRLIEFLRANPDRQFTADELCIAVNGDAEHKRSSVYRTLSLLCEEAEVRKFRSEEQRCSVYQYVGRGCDCDRHFHQKCLSCGQINHLDCDDSLRFAAHLLAEHGFEVNCGQSILYGLCAACRKKEDASHA